ncbi:MULTISPECIES: tRNA adenosine(34) deaminase TadA [Alicyclobacillus]|uniref:tRNA-specific adenosine deaminase n=1 Tax=Alicyclobacillus tolerans TaxID=90970 RepID=A0A1M6PLR7_9BACL|nr:MULTISPECIES: tRNA adenosine(34) deaminase TadA [Alicyclobacillus]SHK08889.1 tRNA(adenine34) deaminase [Alicyclobacillus montanus]
MKINPDKECVERSPEAWMRLALSLAEEAASLGEVPIGALLVYNGQLVAAAYNLRETWRDPTAHAEMLALRQASLRLGGWRLSASTLYVTLEPCAMCAGAILQARVGQVYYGAQDTKAGALESVCQLYQVKGWNHYPQVTGGILAEECGILLKDFFAQVRSRQKTRRDV